VHLGRTGHVQRLLGPAQPAFAVGHHGPQLHAAGHPPRRPELGERLTVLLVRVRGEAGRFPYGGHARRQPQRHPGVAVGSLGVLVDEPRDHHQVPGDVLSERLGQALQFLPYVLVDLVARDVLGDRQPLDRFPVPVPLVPEPTATTPVVAPVVAPVVPPAEATRPPTTVVPTGPAPTTVVTPTEPTAFTAGVVTAVVVTAEGGPVTTVVTTEATAVVTAVITAIVTPVVPAEGGPVTAVVTAVITAEAAPVTAVVTMEATAVVATVIATEATPVVTPVVPAVIPTVVRAEATTIAAVITTEAAPVVTPG
jgi:hypothetical protein